VLYRALVLYTHAYGIRSGYRGIGITLHGGILRKRKRVRKEWKAESDSRGERAQPTQRRP